ncbi:MAG: hypothetical protein J6I66_04835 [Lachnospiraceae bacterium]|nr:hypothetical protein [Lachnospiraceae bacterium]
MEEKVIQYVKTDKELQKHIWIMHLKSDDLLGTYIAFGIILFPEVFIMIAIPMIFVPIVIAEILIEFFVIFKKRQYTIEIYEVKEINDNIVFNKQKYIECVLAKPDNKRLDGYVSGKIIRNRNEKISIGDKVIAVKVGKENIVTEYKTDI